MIIFLILLILFLSAGGLYLSTELKKYSDIGTVDEFIKLKENMKS